MSDNEAAVRTAIIAVRKAVKALPKRDTNPHDHYTYVSIDDYYEALKPLTSEAGLSWTTRCVGWKLVPNMGSTNDRIWVEAQFAFDVFTAGGAIANYSGMYVTHPLRGAQTTGQVFSYADKAFMRTTFGIPTGEKDADADATLEPISSSVGDDDIEKIDDSKLAPIGKAAVRPTADILKPAPAISASTMETMLLDAGASTNLDGDPQLDARRVTDQSIKAIVDIFTLWMPQVKTKNRLLAWHTENVAAIEAVKRFDPAAHDSIKLLFRKRLDEIDPPRNVPAHNPDTGELEDDIET